MEWMEETSGASSSSIGARHRATSSDHLDEGLPPRPTTTTGPNCGSRRPPTTTSMPVACRCTSTAAPGARASSSVAASPSVPPRPSHKPGYESRPPRSCARWLGGTTLRHHRNSRGLRRLPMASVGVRGRGLVGQRPAGIPRQQALARPPRASSQPLWRQPRSVPELSPELTSGPAHEPLAVPGGVAECPGRAFRPLEARHSPRTGAGRRSGGRPVAQPSTHRPVCAPHQLAAGPPH